MKTNFRAVAALLLFVLCNTGRLPAQDNDTLTRLYSKFDFMPGEKVLFFDDFASENIGDFPVAWNTTGSGEIVNFGKYPGKWLKITNPRSIVALNQPLALPENYTIEFDVVPQKNLPGHNTVFFNFYIISTSKPQDLKFGLARPGGTGVRVSFAYSHSIFAYYADGTPPAEGRNADPTIRHQENNKYHIAVWVQKQRIRIYQDETKIFDLARAMSDKVKYNMIRFDEGTPLISNIRVATGSPDLRSKLLTEGKLVSYGIYFDVNDDRIKPASAATLKEIAAILTANPGLKIRIVGHTDADGSEADNLSLSKRRAAAVKAALQAAYGIDGARIETDGKGEKEPVAPNDNATNKALNRRVEFVRI